MNMNNADTNSDATADFPPGLCGYVCCDESGAVIEQKGRNTHSLDEYAPYFNQLANLVGDSLGLGQAEEMVFFGKKQNAICMEVEGSHYGAILKPKCDLREITEFFTEKGGDDDVFA
jgi:hypothetical protein